MKVNVVAIDAPIPAGEYYIGKVSTWKDLIVVIPAIFAAAFAANDFVGGKLTIANAIRTAAGQGRITGLRIVDSASQHADLLIFIFKADLTGTYLDNAAESISLTDWMNWIGTIRIQSSDWQQMANADVVDLEFDMPIEATTNRNLYALIVTTGTPTYTNNCLLLTFGVED